MLKAFADMRGIFVGIIILFVEAIFNKIFNTYLQYQQSVLPFSFKILKRNNHFLFNFKMIGLIKTTLRIK